MRERRSLSVGQLLSRHAASQKLAWNPKNWWFSRITSDYIDGSFREFFCACCFKKMRLYRPITNLILLPIRSLNAIYTSYKLHVYCHSYAFTKTKIKSVKCTHKSDIIEADTIFSVPNEFNSRYRSIRCQDNKNFLLDVFGHRFMQILVARFQRHERNVEQDLNEFALVRRNWVGRVFNASIHPFNKVFNYCQS